MSVDGAPRSRGWERLLAGLVCAALLSGLWLWGRELTAPPGAGSSRSDAASTPRAGRAAASDSHLPPARKPLSGTPRPVTVSVAGTGVRAQVSDASDASGSGSGSGDPGAGNSGAARPQPEVWQGKKSPDASPGGSAPRSGSGTSAADGGRGKETREERSERGLLGGVEVEWRSHGPVPGAEGTAVLQGRSPVSRQQRALVRKLSKARRGTLVQVVREDGSVAQFTVSRVATGAKAGKAGGGPAGARAPHVSGSDAPGSAALRLVVGGVRNVPGGGAGAARGGVVLDGYLTGPPAQK